MNKNVMEISCGFVILLENKMLVLRPSGSFSRGWTFPKGRIDENESILECAIRETFEECGIDLNKLTEKIKYKNVIYFNNKKFTYKRVHYFVIELNINDLPIDYIEFKENNLYLVNKNYLQLTEVDLGYFIDLKYAKNLLTKNMSQIFEQDYLKIKLIKNG